MPSRIQPRSLLFSLLLTASVASSPIVLDGGVSPRTDRYSSSTHDKKPFSTTLTPLLDGVAYGVEVKFNGIPRILELDTGSADTWMFAPGVKCTNAKKKPASCSGFALGDPYTGSVETIPDENFLQVYGSGETTEGYFGYAEVDFAGLTLPRQQVALVNKTYWQGDGIQSGVLGMAQRQNDEAAFEGDDPAKDTQTHRTTYPPVFESAYGVTKQVDSMFSLACQRGKDAGYLTLGGLPPIDFNNDFVSSPFVGVNFNGTRSTKTFYSIKPESYELNGKTHASSYTAIIDSGTAAFRFPAAMADSINAAFDPPATYDPATELYATSCNATIPSFGVGIGGKTFEVKPVDMLPLVRLGVDTCATAVTKGFPLPKAEYPDGLFVLGGNFLRNVIAVFDVGKEEMRFAPHSDY